MVRYNFTDSEGGKRMNPCYEKKDLCVIFDEDLSFEFHVQYAINKANKMFGFSKRCFDHLILKIILESLKKIDHLFFFKFGS